VPIYRLLEEASFDVDDIRIITAAYEAALQLVMLRDRQDPLTELIANKIIEVYRSGEHDPPRLCARALQELGVPIPD
jgi:hypothetical protein